MRLKHLISIFAIMVISALSVLAESSSSSTSTPFGGIGIIITIVMIYQISKSEKIAMEEAEGKRIGVAGWLLFFIGLMVVSGSITLIRIVSDFIQVAIFNPAGLLSGLFLVFELLDILVGVALLYAAYCLWKVKEGARKIAIGVLIFEILTVIVYSFTPGSDEFSSVLAYIGVFWNVIMIIYFSSSTRVQATYAKDAKLPKKKASSNKTVMSWIIAQAIASIIIFVMFQFMYWSQAVEASKDAPCTDYCSKFDGITSYYYGYDSASGGMLCQCHINEEVFNETTLPTSS